MFNANVPEKIIREVTGHTSNALNLYECTSLVDFLVFQGTKPLQMSFIALENQSA